ncbi:MAG: metal-dependent transcriptional regulator [bacterium]
MDVWRAFESNIITHSAAHHIMTISELIETNGYARVTDVAKRLGISRSSASTTLKTLKQRGYVEEDLNKFLRLSPKGKKVNQGVKSNRLLLIKFLKDVLRVNPEQAEIDACKIEHLLSREAGERLLSFLRFLTSDSEKAESVLKAYWQSEGKCEGLAENCPICETNCLMVEED